MNGDRKTVLFKIHSQSQAAAGLPAPQENSLLCPLCWHDTDFDDLTIEHAIPSSVEGHSVTLTCVRCNNHHGSALDAHIAQYQATRDAFRGLGTTPIKLRAFDHEVTANLDWGTPGSGKKNIAIVGKASDPSKTAAIQDELKQGHVEDMHLTFDFGYSKNRFQTGLLRCAYLVLFRKFGFWYVTDERVRAIRRRIMDPSLPTPDLATLVGEVRDQSFAIDNDYFVIAGQMDGIPFFLVVLRLRGVTESRHFEMMPVPHANSDGFFAAAAQLASERDPLTLDKIPPDMIFT